MSYILTPCLTNYLKIESGNSIKAFSKDMTVHLNHDYTELPLLSRGLIEGIFLKSRGTIEL